MDTDTIPPYVITPTSTPFHVVKVAILRGTARDSNMTKTSYSHDVVFSSIFSFPFRYVYLPTPKLKNVHPLFILPKINYASCT